MPDCQPIAYDYVDIPKDAVAVPDEVIVQFSREKVQHEPPNLPALIRRYCLSGTGDCVYSFADSRSCKGRNPAEVVRDLNQNIAACAGSELKSVPGQSTVRRVLVNALIRKSTESSYEPWSGIESKAGDPELSRNTQLRDLGALSAWRYAKPNPDIVTAVFEDAGVYAAHPDFKNSIEELDHSQLVAGLVITCRSDSCTPIGHVESPHGTYITGIIASARNGRGSVGVAWNTRVMPVVAVGESLTNDAIFARALECAVSHRARIINASLGTDQPMLESAAMMDRLLFVERRDFLLVAAAGNVNSDLNLTPRYPAMLTSPQSHEPFPNILVVMPHENDGSFASKAYGKGIVSISAPGRAFSTMPCETENQPCYGAAITASSSNATAFVSGAAALLWSEYPDWNFSDVKWRLLKNANLERRLSQYLEPPRRLNLEAMMHPVTLRNAGENREVRIGQAAVSINFQSAFPPWKCVPKESFIVRRIADGSFEKVNDVDLAEGDSIEARATCEDRMGRTYTASSPPYVAIKKTPD